MIVVKRSAGAAPEMNVRSQMPNNARPKNRLHKKNLYPPEICSISWDIFWKGLAALLDI